MKKLIIAASILSSFLLSACDSKEKKMAYYEDPKNEQALSDAARKCLFNAKDAKDCDVISELQAKREKAFTDKYGIQTKKSSK